MDFSIAQQGILSPERRFSDLYLAAVRAKFTGGVLIKTSADAAIFFRAGSPVHAGGAALHKDLLGELLIRENAVTMAELTTALEEQAKSPGDRPLIGSILRDRANLTSEAIEKAMREQTCGRTALLFGATDGTWQSAPGENARIQKIGVPADGLKILLHALKAGASDQELRDVSDAFLGKAVHLKGATADLPDLAFDEEDLKTLRLLEKPRKPDQLERASPSRRHVRALLRALSLLESCESLPVTKAIPIPGTLRISSQPGTTSVSESEAAGATLAAGHTRAKGETENLMAGSGSGSGAQRERPPPRRPSSKPKSPDPQAARRAEIDAMHASLDKKNHFELLGVTNQTSQADLRKQFTQLAKKFHPDALTGNLESETADKARSVSSAMNEAYQTLSHDESRAKYIALLADDRIKGDARKAERIKDGEVKNQMGMVMLKKKDYQRAREYLNFACESDPTNGLYKTSFAWAIFSDPKFDRKEALEKAEKLLSEALTLPGANALTHYYYGSVLKVSDRVQEARAHFKRASELDPKFADAKRELRLMEMRAKKNEGPQAEKKLDISKLFKR